MNNILTIIMNYISTRWKYQQKQTPKSLREKQKQKEEKKRTEKKRE